MPLTIAPLLIHSEAVPTKARDALRAAVSGPPENRPAELRAAARSIYLETDLDCREAHDLVGLETEGGCGCS